MPKIEKLVILYARQLSSWGSVFFSGKEKTRRVFQLMRLLDMVYWSWWWRNSSQFRGKELWNRQVFKFLIKDAYLRKNIQLGQKFSKFQRSTISFKTRSRLFVRSNGHSKKNLEKPKIEVQIMGFQKSRTNFCWKTIWNPLTSLS